MDDGMEQSTNQMMDVSSEPPHSRRATSSNSWKGRNAMRRISREEALRIARSILLKAEAERREGSLRDLIDMTECECPTCYIQWQAHKADMSEHLRLNDCEVHQ